MNWNINNDLNHNNRYGSNSLNLTNFLRNRVPRFGRFGLSKKYQQALVTPLSDEQRKMVVEKLRKKGLQAQPQWSRIKNELSRKSDESDRKKVTFEKKPRRESACFDPTPRFIEELLSSAPSSPTMSDRQIVLPPPRTTSRSSRNPPSNLNIDPYVSDVSLSAPSSPNNDINTYYDTIPLLPECRDNSVDNFFHPSNVPFRSFFPFTPPNQANSESQNLEMPHRYVIGSDEPNTTSISSANFFFNEPLPPIPTSANSNNNNSPMIFPTPQIKSLTQIMEKLQIQYLKPTFQHHGIDSLNSFTKITDKMLDKMEIESTELRTKIMTAINLLSDGLNETKNTNEGADEIGAKEMLAKDNQNVQTPTPTLPTMSMMLENKEKSQLTTSMAPSNLGHIREPSLENRRRTHSLCKSHRDSKRSGADKRSSHHSPHRGGGSVVACSRKSCSTGISNNNNSNTSSLKTASNKMPPSSHVNISGSGGINYSSRSHKSLRSHHHVQHLSNKMPHQHYQFPHPQFYPHQPYHAQIQATPPIAPLEPMIIHQHIHHHHHVNSSTSNSAGTSSTARPPSQTSNNNSNILTISQQAVLPQLTWQPGNSSSETTHALVMHKLKLEAIQLTEPPYSDSDGSSGIPLRLIERYAYDLEKDIRDVAIAMETVRMDLLNDIGRNANSSIDMIISDQFLNCDGIKTDSLATFFVSIGLPMYAQSLATQHCRNLSTLLLYSDDALSTRFRIAPSHVRWIRREASFLPTGFLQQNHHRYSNNRSDSFVAPFSTTSKFYATDRL